MVVAGVVLRYAIGATGTPRTVGLALIIAGAIGLLLGLIWMFQPALRPRLRPRRSASDDAPSYGAAYDRRTYDAPTTRRRPRARPKSNQPPRGRGPGRNGPDEDTGTP